MWTVYHKLAPRTGFEPAFSVPLQLPRSKRGLTTGAFVIYRAVQPRARIVS